MRTRGERLEMRLQTLRVQGWRAGEWGANGRRPRRRLKRAERSNGLRLESALEKIPPFTLPDWNCKVDSVANRI